MTAAAPAATAVLRVALVGNPNTGKSTLFNALTGLRQRAANFPGVTVEHVEGRYRGPDDEPVEVIDLPGCYSLTATSPDESIAIDAVHGRLAGVEAVDVIVVVVDADQLERNLYLATQVVELGKPVVIALNRMDMLAARGGRVDVPELIHELGVTVIPVVATRGEGIDRLRRAIAAAPALPPSEHALADGQMTGDDEARHRYRWIGEMVSRTSVYPSGHRPGDAVDRVVLHRVWGPLVFLGVLGVMFQAVFAWCRPLTDLLAAAIASTGGAVASLLPPGDLRSLVSDGVFGGVGSVVAFVPQIAVLFLFIGLLEDTGYMARAAFVMDRFLRPMGLHGRSFIPLVSGYACAVPAIMSTRTITDRRDRLATIMVVPLISCSARLPVYTLLISAFVPPIAVWGLGLQGLTLLGLYTLGTLAALAAAFVFRATLLRGPMRPLIIELPGYAVPRPRTLLMNVWLRVRLFLVQAGTIIFAVSVVLWALASYPRPKEGAAAAPDVRLSQSALGRLGHGIEPVVRPLGYDWKIGVSMVSSFAAREVFVSAMATIHGAGDDKTTLTERLRASRDPATGRPSYTPLIAIGLLVFYLFAPMCASTLAVTARETGGGRRGLAWAGLQAGYMLVLAWGAAFLIYHAGLALGLGGLT